MQKHSRKRDAILACLQGTKSHPSAEWVYAQLKPVIPDLSLGTVYRNLAEFRRSGQIISVATVDGTERFDADTHPHTHFICRTCGAVIDLGEVAISAPETDCGRVEEISVVYHGTCKACMAVKI